MIKPLVFVPTFLCFLPGNQIVLTGGDAVDSVVPLWVLGRVSSQSKSVSRFSLLITLCVERELPTVPFKDSQNHSILGTSSLSLPYLRFLCCVAFSSRAFIFLSDLITQ